MSKVNAYAASSPLAELSERDRRVALMIADGMAWDGSTFAAGGFPVRSAGVRAAEYKHKSGGRYEKFREAVRFALDHRFLRLAPIALSVLEREMANGGKDRVKAAIETLSRTGWPASRQLEIHHQHSLETLTPDQLRSRLASLIADLSPAERQQLAQAGIALPAPEIIEAEFTEFTELSPLALADAAFADAPEAADAGLTSSSVGGALSPEEPVR